MGKLTLKDKLNVMKEIDISNKQHVEDWKRKNMKIWVADYGFIDRDGNKHDEEGDEAFPYAGAHQEQNQSYKEGSDVGICNDNIW